MKKLLIISLALLLFFNFYLLYKRNKLMAQIEQKPTQIDEDNTFEECYKGVITLNSTLLNPQILLYSQNKEYQLKELVGKHSRLIFYYSEENCQKCIVDELQKILSFFPETMKDRIILIENTKNVSNNPKRSFNFNYYETNQFLFESSVSKLLSKHPILFLIDKDLLTHFVYIPTPSTPNLTTIYLTKIKKTINNDEK